MGDHLNMLIKILFHIMIYSVILLNLFFICIKYICRIRQHFVYLSLFNIVCFLTYVNIDLSPLQSTYDIRPP